MPSSDPIKVCCVCNKHDQLLYFHFNSRYGAVQAYVQPGVCTYFNYYDDGYQRVMSAFDEQNNLIHHEAFVPDDLQCFLVSSGGTGRGAIDPPRHCTTVPI